MVWEERSGWRTAAAGSLLVDEIGDTAAVGDMAVDTADCTAAEATAGLLEIDLTSELAGQEGLGTEDSLIESMVFHKPAQAVQNAAAHGTGQSISLPRGGSASVVLEGAADHMILYTSC